MSIYLAGLAALTLMGAATLPLQANAAERLNGVSNKSVTLSAQRHWRGRYYGHRYWGPRYRYWGPRYGYYGDPYYYGYGYPYRYYRPGFAFGVGPFGFRFF